MKVSPASSIDHTLLRADATEAGIRQLCQEALKFGFASVCVPPVHVPCAANILSGSRVAVGSVIGFPFGYVAPVCKAFEAENLVNSGADELDMVVDISLAMEGRFCEIDSEIRQVIHAAKGSSVKVILECCYLDNGTKEVLAGIAIEAGAAFVKTSTGFGSGGATLEDVHLLVRAAAGRAGVKAAGGIRSWDSCREFLQAGATRIGTSHGITIMKEWQEEVG